MTDTVKMKKAIKNGMVTLLGGMMALYASGANAADTFEVKQNAGYNVEMNADVQTVSATTDFAKLIQSEPVPTEAELQAKLANLDKLEKALPMKGNVKTVYERNKTKLLEMEQNRQELMTRGLATTKQFLKDYENGNSKYTKEQIIKDAKTVEAAVLFMMQSENALASQMTNLIFATPYMTALKNNDVKTINKLAQLGLPLVEKEADPSYKPVSNATLLALQGAIKPATYKAVIDATKDYETLKKSALFILQAEKMPASEKKQYKVTDANIQKTKDIFAKSVQGRVKTTSSLDVGQILINQNNSRQMS